MSSPHETYEIRCPVHGFIPINDWEKEIINQPAFQRLRRIRQLGWTEMVYPGAMHTRFEHSLGVMHVATRLYNAIVKRSRKVLKRELIYTAAGFHRDRILVRLAALLHDIGHAPFSHSAEELFPEHEDGKSRYTHEQYSAAIIKTHLKDAIENHPLNHNHGIRAETVADFLEGSTNAGRSIFWRELVSGQMDADRIDYLLRDSLHTGVDYGKFDWRRLVNSIQAVPGVRRRGLRLGVREGGFHAAESLVLARYFMFTQVYFHKTRVAFDHHLRRALSEILPGGKFPRPAGEELAEYLHWDDWRVLGVLANGGGGDHGRRLAERDHFREVYHTKETPKPEELEKFKKVRGALKELIQAEERADKSWYKVGRPDIPIISDNADHEVLPLSEYSDAVASLAPIGKVMLFCRKEDEPEARKRLQKLGEIKE